MSLVSKLRLPRSLTVQHITFPVPLQHASTVQGNPFLGYGHVSFALLPPGIILSTNYVTVSTLYNSIFVTLIQLPDAVHYTSPTLQFGNAIKSLKTSGGSLIKQLHFQKFSQKNNQANI